MATGSAAVINASPQRHGTCATLARLVAGRMRYDSACVQELDGAGSAEAQAAFIQITDYAVAPCRGCNACASTPGHRCVIEDDMGRLMDVLAECSELTVVCPVFFAGPPAQFKAVLDRLQPHFWRGTRLRPKRPATLYVVGQGGDPHGFQPLVTILRSALAVAGFSVDKVHACIGVDKRDLAAYLDQELSCEAELGGIDPELPRPLPGLSQKGTDHD